MLHSRLKLLALFAGTLFATMAPASAQTTVTARVTVRPGPLAISGTAGIQLNFSDAALFLDYDNAQTVTGASFSAAPGITINDRRGSTANGWNVTMLASDFAGTTVPANTIPASGFTYTPGTGTVTRQSGPPPGTAPAEVVAGALTLDSARKVAVATNGNGRGRYLYVPNPVQFSLSVPAGTLDDTYNSTVTMTVVAGP